MLYDLCIKEFILSILNKIIQIKLLHRANCNSHFENNEATGNGGNPDNGGNGGTISFDGLGRNNMRYVEQDLLEIRGINMAPLSFVYQ
jgi:hypothetical protein